MRHRTTLMWKPTTTGPHTRSYPWVLCSKEPAIWLAVGEERTGAGWRPFYLRYDEGGGCEIVSPASDHARLVLKAARCVMQAGARRIEAFLRIEDRKRARSIARSTDRRTGNILKRLL
jgi:hypothetical protein